MSDQPQQQDAALLSHMRVVPHPGDGVHELALQVERLAATIDGLTDRIREMREIPERVAALEALMRSVQRDLRKQPKGDDDTDDDLTGDSVRRHNKLLDRGKRLATIAAGAGIAILGTVGTLLVFWQPIQWLLDKLSAGPVPPVGPPGPGPVP